MTTKSERRVQVVMSWGGTPQGMLFVKQGARVVIGDSPGVSFLLPSEHVAAPFALVESDERGFVVRAPEGAIVRATRSGDALTDIPVDTLGARAITIDPSTAVEIELGPFVFFVAESDGEHAKPPLARPDVTSWRWIGVSLAVHVAFLGSLLFMPPNAGALSLDLTGSQRDYVRIRLDAMERERIELPPIETGDDGAPSTAGQASEGDDGTAGAVEEPRRTGGGVRVRGESADRRVPLTATSVTTAGALGMIASFSQSFAAVSSPFGAEAAMGWAPDAAYGSLMADAAGFGAGTGGLGMQGTGRGGGCVPGQPCGAGTIGVGAFGTGGFGATCSGDEFRAIEVARGHAAAVASCEAGGLGHGFGTGSGVLREREHVARVPPPTCARDASGQCAQVTNGGLSREQVRMVITRNRGQIRHCYEQALVARPDLEGRLSVRWMIHPEGRVMGVQISGGNEIQSPQVEQCMVQAVSRWQFPASTSPTAVTYPFVFQSHG